MIDPTGLSHLLTANIRQAERPFEFASEKRKRISQQWKERFGFTHGKGKKQKKKRKKG